MNCKQSYSLDWKSSSSSSKTFKQQKVIQPNSNLHLYVYKIGWVGHTAPVAGFVLLGVPGGDHGTTLLGGLSCRWCFTTITTITTVLLLVGCGLVYLVSETNPIGSMCGIYLPTVMVDFDGFHVGKDTIHSSNGNICTPRISKWTLQLEGFDSV